MSSGTKTGSTAAGAGVMINITHFSKLIILLNDQMHLASTPLSSLGGPFEPLGGPKDSRNYAIGSVQPLGRRRRRRTAPLVESEIPLDPTWDERC